MRRAMLRVRRPQRAGAADRPGSGLKELPDDSFDYVVLEETLQTLRHPVELLQEMLRVGRRGIVSFPNFGFWKVRLDLLLARPDAGDRAVAVSLV